MIFTINIDYKINKNAFALNYRNNKFVKRCN